MNISSFRGDLSLKLILQVGMFQDRAKKTRCANCPPRFFADSLGSTSCKPCPEGYVAKEKASEKCSKCPPGNIARDKMYCDPCEKGEHSVKSLHSEGAIKCVPCDYGTANDEVAKADSCDKCKEGSYSDKKGALKCIQCQPGTQYVNRKKPCVSCRPGKHCCLT